MEPDRIIPNRGREHRQGWVVIDFRFTWRHNDGSIVSFTPEGWTSSDQEKAAWLNAMSNLSSSEPAAPPLVRIWLAEECLLIEVHGGAMVAVR